MAPAALVDSLGDYLDVVAPHHVDSVRARMLDHLDDDDLIALATVFGKLRAALDR